jgi:hypothetical protein
METLEQKFERRARVVRQKEYEQRQMEDFLVDCLLIGFFGGLGIGMVIWRISGR